MKLYRYRVRQHDNGQCDRCGYPTDTGDYLWYDPNGLGFYCSTACARDSIKSPKPRHQDATHGAPLRDYGGADDQCGHVSSDADPGL